MGVPLSDKILAIVNLIVQKLMGEYAWEGEAEIVESLLASGFEPEEIDAAFDWMAHLSHQTRSLPPEGLAAPMAQRVFTAEETRQLGPEVLGFLTRLRTHGLVDEETHEEIVERAMQVVDDGFTLKEMRIVAALTILSRCQVEWQREMAFILEEDWAHIYH